MSESFADTLESRFPDSLRAGIKVVVGSLFLAYGGDTASRFSSVRFIRLGLGAAASSGSSSKVSSPISFDLNFRSISYVCKTVSFAKSKRVI